MATITVTHPQSKTLNLPGDKACPASFQAEVETRVSQSAYDKPVVDAAGQYPTLADQLDAQGVPLLIAQREELTRPNPAWTPTYERVVLDDPVEHQVAVCPNCGTPIKVV